MSIIPLHQMTVHYSLLQMAWVAWVASIFFHDENGKLVDSTRSDENGYFHLDLPADENFTITGKKDGYDVLQDLGYSTKGLHFGVDSLLFPLWKQSLFVKGK